MYPSKFRQPFFVTAVFSKQSLQSLPLIKEHKFCYLSLYQLSPTALCHNCHSKSLQNYQCNSKPAHWEGVKSHKEFSYPSLDSGDKIEAEVDGGGLRRRLIRKRWLKNWIGGIVHLWQIRMGRNWIGKSSEGGEEFRWDEGQNLNLDSLSQGEQEVDVFTNKPYSF